MNKKTFISRSVLNGFVWIAAFLFIGYLFRQAQKMIILYPTRESIFLFGFIFFFIALFMLRWIIIKKGKQFFSSLYSVWKSVKTAIANNPDVKKFTAKHSSLSKFIKERLNKDEFWGLPATLLIVSFIYALFLLGGIVEDVIASDIIVSVDARVMNFFALFRSANLTQFFLWVALLGKWQVVSCFIVAVIGVLWARRKRLYIFPLLLTVIGAEIFTAISKIIFHRPRPELGIYTERSFSFPSGHSTIAVAFYGFLTYMLIRNFKRWEMRVNIFFTGIAIILLIGFSRLYLGAHYVSDVWGGYFVGTLWLIIGISVSEWVCSRKGNIKFILTTRGKLVVSAVLILLFGSCVLIGLNYHP